MGPMRAACRFAQELGPRGLMDGVARVQTELYGSLALTGLGHATDRAVLLGWRAMSRRRSIRRRSSRRWEGFARRGGSTWLERAPLLLTNPATWSVNRATMFPPGARTQHPNGVRFKAYGAAGEAVCERTFFPVGGGFIVEDGEADSARTQQGEKREAKLPFPFHNAAELLATAQENELSISQLMLENECALVASDEARRQSRWCAKALSIIWRAMQACVERGMAAEGILPGGLKVRRRAHRLAARLREKEADGMRGDPLAPLDWVTVYAMAVNEENAAGGRVVTAPTNGAAGVVPAVAHYYAALHSRGGPRRHPALLSHLGGHRHPL